MTTSETPQLEALSLTAGIPEYWVVDAEAGVVDVFVLAEDGYAATRLPGSLRS